MRPTLAYPKSGKGNGYPVSSRSSNQIKDQNKNRQPIHKISPQQIERVLKPARQPGIYEDQFEEMRKGDQIQAYIDHIFALDLLHQEEISAQS